MAMELDLLLNKRKFPDMEADIFIRFLEKDNTAETSGKYQIFFPSDYVSSAVQDPNTYDKLIQTDFINPIHPISHSDDGSNVIFDNYQNFQGGDISWVAVDFNDTTTTDDVCIKIEHVPYGRIDLTGYVTAPWTAPHYTDTCIGGEAKFYT